MPNTTPNPTPSEADLKAAEEINQLLFPCSHFDPIHESNKKDFIQIISHHMQPERDELERLREEVTRLKDINNKFDEALAAIEAVLEDK